jgi:hypothetical protein
VALLRGVLVCAAVVGFFAFAGSAVGQPSERPFEVVPGSFHVVTTMTLPNGEVVPDNRAGAHADLTTSFDLAHEPSGKTDNDLRTTIVNYPPGIVGNNTAVPTCTDAQLIGGSERLPACPIASQVGLISFEVSNEGRPPAHFTVPLYNMEVTSFGVTVEFGYKTVLFTQVLQISVRPGDSGVTATAPATPKSEPFNISVTVWGLPAAHVHDAQRGMTCGEGFEVPAVCRNEFGGPQEAHIPIEPFLSNPTSCEPHVAHMEAYSWELPEEPFWSHAETEMLALTECERVPFEPSIEVAPTTRSAESSSGLDISLVVPQSWENPVSLSTANLKDTVVALPVGYTANPSLASGLGTCTPEQFESETYASLPGAGCPAESKIGTVDVETPVLEEKHLTGNIYIATPYDNKPEFSISPEHPDGSLLALYIVVKDPQRGIIVKLAGKIEPNPVTGQLVTTFDNNPQVPFSKFTLKLRQGANSPLVSPPACGTYTAEAALTPWSEPLVPRLVDSSFQIENGIGGGPCPAGGVPPFKPALIAGTLNNNAGAYSPMDIHITRNDGEQEITRFSSILPPGLSANLSGVPFCPNADIEAAKLVSGAQEEADPSCPAASEIGHTLVGAGVGSVLAYTPGKVYLAGPYNGAPFSVVSITSAKVGPFDLGTVVIRFALEINPETAVVTVDAKASDPIPHIIKGIVIHVRDIHVYIDRPDFMLNPTSCDPLNFAATVGGGGADPTNLADQQFVTTNDSFQLANCRNLKFEPKFSVSTSAKTSRLDGASLTAKLTVPGAIGAQANISRVKVELPEQLPSRLPTLQKACTATQFETNPAGCPPASIIGHAKAITPILPVPLEGPAYFVSHGGEGWPSLVVVLQGYGVTIDLTGTTFISKAGVTSSTFKTVPDQPVTSFELTLPEGPYSALTALGNLCSTTKTVTVKKKVTVKIHGHKKTITRKIKQTRPATLQMPTELVAQNGAEIHQDTPITVAGCPKARSAKKAMGARGKR